MKKASTLIATCVLAYAAIVAFWYSISGSLNHDEHQFMASAFMVAHDGLQPYQDFAYFQMPNLVYLYAPLFFLPYPFLAARLFVAVCAFGICLTVFLTTRSLFRRSSELNALIIPVATVLLLIHSPLFQYTSSHVWNHMPAILCALLAFLLHCHAIQSKRPLVLFLFSGVSLGMAIGIRLSFAPVIVPFLFAIAVHRPAATKDRLLRVVAFTIGGLLANLPAIYFCLTNYQQFVFGNLGYRQLQPKFPTPMTFVEKIQYLKPVFAPPGDLLILLLAFYSLAVCGIELKRRSAQPRLETQFLLLLLVFILLGCIAPTPTFYQYHFALVPFLLLLMVYALSELRSMFAEVASLLLIVGSLFSTVYVFPLKNAAKHRRFLAPDSWTPMRVHAEAQWIRSHVDPEARAKVLTLSPLYAIESGLSIYNEFVTGPFAWRVSDLLPEKQAAQRGLPLLLEAARLFDEKRPRTVLTGKEGKELEIPLTREAERRGYKPVATPTGSVIWKSPE